MKTQSRITLSMAMIAIIVFFSSCKNKTTDEQNEPVTAITSELFGLMPDGDSVFLYKLKSDKDITVKIINYGGIVTEIITPDREGNPGNVVLGFDNLDQYLAGHPNFGALIGRFGNRIAKGQFELDGVTYNLAINNGPNTLHGGEIGFDDVLWDAEIVDSEEGGGLQLSYYSEDMEEGYPGNLDVTVLYKLVGKDLEITYHAVTDKATPVNLTNHTYFNLSGEGTIMEHILTLNASRYTPVDETLIPTGEIAEVAGTPFDFRKAKSIGRDFEATDGGYDHNFVIDKENSEMTLVATVEDPNSGRILKTYSTEPGVQFYTGNFLDGSLKSGNRVFMQHSGFCLETQHFPDSPNQPGFPNTILQPGEKFYSKTVYRFIAEK